MLSYPVEFANLYTSKFVNLKLFSAFEFFPPKNFQPSIFLPQKFFALHFVLPKILLLPKFFLRAG